MLADKKLLIVNFAVICLVVGAVLVTAIWTGEQDTIVALARNETEVTNVGNVDVWLERSGGAITGAAILGVNRSLEIEEMENVRAEQNPFR